MKDIRIPPLRAFIRAHGPSQTRIGGHWLASKPAFMRPDGHGQEGTRTHRFATLEQASALRVPRKGREGSIPWRKAYWPWGQIDSSKRRAGAPLRGLRPGMRPHGLRDQPEGSGDPRARLRTSRSSPPSSTSRAGLDRPNLRGHIESHGGAVVLATTLSASRRSDGTCAAPRDASLSL
jgi:hypothetical protein